MTPQFGARAFRLRIDEWLWKGLNLVNHNQMVNMEMRKMGMVFRLAADVLAMVVVSGHERKIRSYMAAGMCRDDAEQQVSVDNECYIHA